MRICAFKKKKFSITRSIYCEIQMLLLRSILSRSHRHRQFASLCSLKSEKSSSALTASPEAKPLQKTYVASYLVNRCGLTQQKATSTAKRVHFDGPSKPDAVLNFLQEQGFNKSQIAEIVVARPHLLVANPQRTLLPKIEFLVRVIGISKKDALTTVSSYPLFLAIALEKVVLPKYNYLKDILGAERARILLTRGCWFYYIDLQNRVIPNVEWLRELGVPDAKIKFALFHYPEIFGSKPDEFKAIAEEVKQMGFDLSKTTFVVALHVRTGKGNLASWDKAYKTYSKWGWSEDDIHLAFKKHPGCMLLSEKKITKTLDFLVNGIGRDAKVVVPRAYVLFYSLEKRIVPRCSVVHQLVLKGFVKEDWSLTSVLCCREQHFLDGYVKRYIDKVPQLYDLYKGKASIMEA